MRPLSADNRIFYLGQKKINRRDRKVRKEKQNSFSKKQGNYSALHPADWIRSGVKRPTEVPSSWWGGDANRRLDGEGGDQESEQSQKKLYFSLRSSRTLRFKIFVLFAPYTVKVPETEP
jgi:hypothetical protein